MVRHTGWVLLMLCVGGWAFAQEAPSSQPVTPSEDAPTDDAPAEAVPSEDPPHLPAMTEPDPVDESTGDDLPGVVDEPEDPALANLPLPRALGIGLTAVREHGYGGLVRWRDGAWAVEGAVALALYSLDSGEGDPCDETVINAPLRVTGAGLWYLTEAGRNSQHALKLGGLYDVEFGGGVLGGYHAEFSLSRTVAFTFGIGLQWMPDAQDQARQVLRKTCRGQAFADPDTFDVEIRPYVGLGLTLFVF
ncbi:MAG: hypothetical protein ACE366_08970 [Bradymonadia bacterium]